MSFNTLEYSYAELLENGNELTLHLKFNCPRCHQPFEQVKTATVPANRELNVNGQVTFACPVCLAQFQLYGAFHKSKGVNDGAVCVATEPIPSNWWAVT